MKHSTKNLLPALLAVGGGLASAPAASLELGEINVQSTLGQPLRASIAFALGPNEQISDYCISLRPGLVNSGIPAISQATISVANGTILLAGKAAVREPLVTTRLQVACPYTPNISRDYMMFINPAQHPVAQSVAPQPAQAAAPVPAAAAAPVQPTTRRPAARRPAAVNRSPIDASQRYRVQPGESLSEIAQRIENRSVGLWSAVTQIFDANPAAFIDADPNRLKAGAWLTIPDFGPNARFADATAVATPPAEAPAAVAAAPAQANAEQNPVVQPEAVSQTAQQAIDAYDSNAASASDDTGTLEPAALPDTTGMQPGDVILDTELEAPETARSPNVPVATVVTETDTVTDTSSWLMWLVGGGIVLFAGLLAFSRRGRKYEDADPAPTMVVEAHPQRRRTDGNTEELPAVAEMEFVIEDDSPTHENLILDADLEIGTGLEEGTDIDVAQDFGYAATPQLDFELPEASEAGAEGTSTDIIAANIEASSILETELLPEDDDYDMSVIVDATKMPMPDDVTERDLKAVVVDGGDETLVSGDYTVSKEVDYDILEQDYEEELTATQALNLEIERAAAEIAERLEKGEPIDDLTSKLPLATVTSIDGSDPTVDVEELEDTGVNPEITENMLADDKTVEMPANDGEETVEMTVESGKVDTRAR